MNILFAPQNIASMPAITVESLNKLKGIKARYISTYQHKYISDNPGLIKIKFPLEYKTFKESPFINITYRVLYNFWFRPVRFLKLCRWIMWADVVHWNWDSMYTNNLDLRLVKFFRKKRFIEWVGSEMRIPEITMLESKWYKAMFNKGYEYSKVESKEQSYKLQQKFARYNFVPVLVPEMHLFLKPGLFNQAFMIQYRIFQKDKFPQTFYPQIKNDKIIIVHSPSAKYAKGSNYIISVVEELKKEYPVEFILLHNVPRPTVIDTMKSCDIFIDQIILGSYAAAAIEAMSLGKPTVAFIMPGVYKNGTPESCPVVNANPDTLKEKLTLLIKDPELRNSIGIKSRQFVEETHDADKIAIQLLSIYNGEHKSVSVKNA